MKQLNLLIKRCEECPYYRYNYDVRNDICYFREDSPFATIRQGSELIDARCGLADAPVDDGPEDQDASPHEWDYSLFQQNSLAGALSHIPEEWLQDLSPTERQQINEQEDERIERMLREEGFDPFDDGEE